MKTAVALSSSFLLLASLSATADPRDSFHDDSRRTPRMLWGPEFHGSAHLSGEALARAYLAENRTRFALPDDDRDLPLLRVEESLTATHYRFAEQAYGISVEGGEIVVSISRTDGRIARVANNVWPIRTLGFRTTPSIGPEDALDIAWSDLRVHGPLLAAVPTAELLWQPSDEGLRLVYKTFVPVEAPFGYWEHRIDAETGEILDVRLAARIRKPIEKVDFAEWTGPILDRAEATTAVLAAVRSVASPSSVVDGSCKTFDPDPRTTLLDSTLEDGSTIPAAGYFTRTLRQITLTGSTYSLVGPWVKIENSENPNTAPSTTTTGVWNNTRGVNAFDDTLVYFHLDQSQRYMQSLGFTGVKGIQQLSISADSDGLNGADNSWYVPGGNRLAFGHGCVDDDEDADVVLHEYGHAIQESIVPGWGGGDTGAIGEGFGDYWGGSYSYGTPNGPLFHPAWIYSWDGHDLCWSGRVMDQTGYCYIVGQTYGAHSTVSGMDTDETWSTPLFQALVNGIAQGIPHSEMDRIVLESHFGMVNGTKMPDLANSTLAAATALYPSGLHHDVFLYAFADVCILTVPTLVAPTLTFPAGGNTLPGGTPTNVTWNRNGGPGTATYLVQYTNQCTPAMSFTDNVEGAAQWTASIVTGTQTWNVLTTGSHSPTHSWFFSDTNKKTEARLTQNTGVLVPINAQLAFWHNYTMESGYDGGVVEISTNGGSTWADLGPQMTQHGYDAVLATGSNLAGRSAFTGASGGWVETRADLSGFAGQTVKLRFDGATDGKTAGTGWWIDDISIGAYGLWTTIGTSATGASSLAWTPPTTAGTDYCVRITGSAGGYYSSPTVSGSPFTITAPSAAATPVPDGSATRPGTAMKGKKNGTSNVDLTWDASCPGPTGYNVYTGALSSFTAVTGGYCAVGTGSATRAIAANSWWIVTSTSSASTIGSQGLLLPAAERTLTGWTTVCSQTIKNTSATCP